MNDSELDTVVDGLFEIDDVSLWLKLIDLDKDNDADSEADLEIDGDNEREFEVEML